MKKNYLWILSLLTTFFLHNAKGFSQTTSIPDAAFEQALIDFGYDNELDGLVTTSTLQSVTFLDVSGRGIASLDGIEGFTNLEMLFCGQNNLTTLDLTGLTGLTTIVLDNNPFTSLSFAVTGIKQMSAFECDLTTLDVTGLPLLEVLHVGNNDLTSLNVQGLSMLRFLACFNNDLTEINVTGTNLVDFYCGGNQLTALSVKNQTLLTSFDATNNPDLACIEVDNVTNAYNNDNWFRDVTATYRTNCDVTVIPDGAFEQELIALGYDDVQDGAVSNPSISGVTTLDISGKAIYNITGIQGFTSLKSLNCSNNNITFIDAAGITGLDYLDCSNNVLYSLNLSTLTSLKTLICTNTTLYSLDLGMSTSLTELKCANNYLSSLQVSFQQNLKTLECNNNNLYELDLAYNSALERLVCNNNNIAYSLSLENAHGIKYIDCSSNNLQNVYFNSPKPVEYMYCQNNVLNRVETWNTPNLIELNCRNNSLYDLDIREVPNLQKLDCSQNYITNFWIGGTNLQNLKCNDNTIAKLQLYNFTNLTDLECQNNNLTFLNLKNTAISTLNSTNNPDLSCISLDNPEVTIDNPDFQKDATASFELSCQGGPWTLIPDANFEATLIAQSYDELLDGQVSTAVVSQIGFLDLYQKQVADLTGIQDFTSMFGINLEENNLTNLDALSGLSQLETVYCGENLFTSLNLDGLGLTSMSSFYCSDSSLSSLNFGNGMPNLNELYVNNNQLTSLDVTTLPELNYMECFQNQLTSLNITGLENLYELYCNENLLTDLDLTGVTNLNYLQVWQNAITSLDFSTNPNLYDIDCSTNQLTTLNLSGLSNLQYLTCSNNSLSQIDLSDIDNLESLYCSYNQLTELELTQNYIYEVYCDNNQLTTLDLSNIGYIEGIDCNNNRLCSLILNPSIYQFSCNNNLLSGLDISALDNLNAFSFENNYLTSIDLTNKPNLYNFSGLNNDLECVKVDDVEYAQEQDGWVIDSQSLYSTDCELSTCLNTALWDHSEWIPAAPDSATNVLVQGTFTPSENMQFCSLKLLDNAVFNVPSEVNLHVSGKINVAETASLTFENNANLTQDGTVNKNNGNITSKRNATMRRQDYVYWSSPVMYMNLQDFSEETLTNRFYTLNESTNQFAWTDPTEGEFYPAQGYMIRAPNTFPPNGSLATFNGVFTGVPNNGDLEIEVYHTPNKGFNLIGNPYPSTLDADLFMDANPDIDALYFWTHASQLPGSSNYATYNATGAAQAAPTSPDEQPNGTIQVGQGFLAKMTADAPLVSHVYYSNDMRVANNENQFFRSQNTIEKNRIWLNLSDTTKKLNQILTGYITNATNGIDSRFDGKLIETGGSKLYNLIQNSEYVIQARALPFTANDVVALGFKTETAGNFIISLDHADGLFANGQDIYIKDNLTGAIHDMNQSAYMFASEAGTFNSRFEIVYQTTLGVDSPDQNNLVVFHQDHTLQVNSARQMMQEIKVFDIRGRLIYELHDINSNSAALVDVKAKSQVVLVQIKLADQTIVTKKAIH